MEAIKLDKERHLKITLGGMQRFQELTGKSLLRGFSLSEMTEKELNTFIWSCLVWEDRKLTVEDLGFLIDFDRLQEISEKLKLMLQSHMPKREVTENPNP